MLHGHYWTIRSHLASRFRPAAMPPSQAWFCDVRDPIVGTVRLTGRFRDEAGSSGLLLVVHGLGGSAQSAYTYRAAEAARSAGLSCLRLNLRGADLRGEDLFHAALTADIKAADANNAGIFMELDAIAAVIIGGTVNGGRFSMAGAVIGALIIQSLTTTIITRGVPPQVVLVFKAFIIIIVALIQSGKLRDRISRLVNFGEKAL